ncbi:DUF4177 domain-containing protein [Pseudomonas sp. NPDC078416]|uniref:DUF4177 domain-containing protein n=1 Tax=Pseudomonas TaxID=286 RepID=UPI00155868C4|nr:MULTISPECIES: DUF4177 domain-containing protein [Pseudomonas]UZJ58193.1 DUF4177 domain-containing protein [Pseudomonas sp. KU26590]
MFVYKMVQVPPNVEVQAKNQKGNEAAAYLQNVVNQHAGDGWEFYRIDTIGVAVQPGCFAGLFGQKAELSQYYVISFRRPG